MVVCYWVLVFGEIHLERLSDNPEKPSPLMACDEPFGLELTAERLSRVGEGLGEGGKTSAEANS
jgi:hypothetical protein